MEVTSKIHHDNSPPALFSPDKAGDNREQGRVGCKSDNATIFERGHPMQTGSFGPQPRILHGRRSNLSQTSHSHSHARHKDEYWTDTKGIRCPPYPSSLFKSLKPIPNVVLDFSLTFASYPAHHMYNSPRRKCLVWCW